MNQIEEQEYIARNFPVLQTNFKKYSAINLRIKTKLGKLVRFLFNRMQSHLWTLFLTDLKSGKPIRWYVIKSRQQGSTTWFLGLFYWLTSLRTNINALLLAHDEDAAKSLGVKIQYLHFKGHRELQPKVRTMNRNQIHFATPLEEMKQTSDPGIDCVIDISTGDSEGIGRSRTYQYVLITEFGTMADIGIDIPKMFTALGNCVAEDEGTGIFIETTATGENFAKDFWDDANNGYRKIFISWVADDTYRIDLPLGKYPELFSDSNSQYGNEIEEFENIKQELIKWYPELVSNNLKSSSEYDRIQLEHEAYCRIAWRRKILDTKFFGDYAERRAFFKHEYPTTVYDAFSASSKTIFPIARLLEREDYLRENRIKPELYEFNSSIDISKEWRKAFYQTKYGKLRVFKEPQPEKQYVIGGDAAQGIPDGDDSALVVLELPQLEEVASINDNIPPSDYAKIAYCLGMLYNQARLAIELNDKGGYAALKLLEDVYRYRNLYYVDGQNPSNIRYGWVTNGVTKSVMIAEAKELIRAKQTIINSIGSVQKPALIGQLKNYVELKPGVYGGLPGKMDDLATAFMIAIQCAKSIHIPSPAEKPLRPPKGSPDYFIQQLRERSKIRERFNRKYYS